MIYERFEKRHLLLVDAFSCVESDETLGPFRSQERRKIRKHSQEMDRFLKEEAFEEQELGMNTTFVLLNDEANKIIAYMSLCNDSINLEFQERESAGITYGSAPALKIARLAVDASAARHGIGKQLIAFAAYQAQLVREHSGIFFLTLDCYSHRVSFYESIGFVKNLIQPVVLPYDSPISMRLGLDSYLATIARQDSESGL